MRLRSKLLTTERKTQVLEELEQSSSPGFDYFLLVTLSCMIATFGLINNSAAVIIGAMLVAPLMSPILGLSLSSVAGEHNMFQHAFIALLEGAVLAVGLSALLSWVAYVLPLGVLIELPQEVISRTRPSPFDLVIALAGGAAAAYSLANPRLSAALPGVAIATAIMPPLCSVGIGVALNNQSVALGALLLFVTNVVTISFAGIVVFLALGFRPTMGSEVTLGIPRSLIASLILVLITTIPLVILTVRFVSQTSLERRIREAVSSEISTLDNSQLVDVNTTGEDNGLLLVVTVRTSVQPTYSQVVSMQKAIAARLQRTIALHLIVIPTTNLDPLIPPTFTPTATPGPSDTPTATLTPMPRPSLAPTQSFTPTQTATYTQTPTPTPTSTPVLAYIANTGGLGIYLRNAPAGKVTGSLPEGSAVQILYQRETVNDREWIEVRDLFARTGWILSEFLVIKP